MCMHVYLLVHRVGKTKFFTRDSVAVPGDLLLLLYFVLICPIGRA